MYRQKQRSMMKYKVNVEDLVQVQYLSYTLHNINQIPIKKFYANFNNVFWLSAQQNANIDSLAT